MKQQQTDDESDWTEEEVSEEEEGEKETVSPSIVSEPEEDDTVVDSVVVVESPIRSPPKPKSTSSRESSGSRDSAGSSNSKGTLLQTPTKSKGNSSPSAPPQNDMNDLKTPKMTSSAKRPPSKSPGTSKSPGRPSLSKSPKNMPPHPPSTAAAAVPNTLARKPERQPSMTNVLSASLHSQSTDTARSKSGSSATSASTTTHRGSSHSRQQHQQQIRRRCRLQWKKSVRVNVIPNLSYFSEQEKLLTWYTADEYSLMEDECDLTSECLDARKPLWPGFCGRGLESWTVEGEQRKEQHVQLAIDIVWQAQLDQWRQASNTDECWEFIRSQYLQVSKPCLKLASKLAEADEREIQPYLSSVKALEKSRRKMLGIRSRSGSSGSSKRVIRRGKVSRTVSDTGAYAQQLLSQSAHGPEVRRSPRRSLSDMPTTPTKAILRPAIKYPGDWDQTPVAGSANRSSGRKGKSRSASDAIGVVSEDDVTQDSMDNDNDDDDDTDGSSTLASSIVEAYSNKKKLANKKIEFKPKSKTKVPTSPVGSLAASIDTNDSSSIIRRMRSHLSVASDESTRRRMMRTAAMKTPL